MPRVLCIFVLLSVFSVSAQTVTNVEIAFVNIYAPILKSMNLNLKIETYEESDDYYGGASLEGNIYRISFGKNIRANKGGMLAFALCHEVGHLLGGAPKKPTSTWASTEAQSDFYATSVCLKKLYSAYPQLLKKERKPAPEVAHACAQTFTRRLEKRICEDSAQSTFVFFNDVWSYIGYSGFAKPTFAVQTPATVEKNRNYPSLQCRLEIGLAGALCRDQSCGKPACF